METDFKPLPAYEGYRREIHPINDVVFTHEVVAWREDRPDMQRLKARGVGEEAAIQHSVVTINREISRLGS